MNNKITNTRCFLLSRFFSNLAKGIFDACIIFIFLSDTLKFEKFGLFLFYIFIPCAIAYPLVASLVSRRTMGIFIKTYSIILIFCFFMASYYFTYNSITVFFLGVFCAIVKLFSFQLEIISSFMYKELTATEKKERNTIYSKITSSIAYGLVFISAFFLLNENTIQYFMYCSSFFMLISLVIIQLIKVNVADFSDKKIYFISDFKGFIKKMRYSSNDEIVKIFLQSVVIYLLYYPIFIVLLPLGIKNIGIGFKGFSLVIACYMLGYFLPYFSLKRDCIYRCKLKELISMCFTMITVVGAFLGIVFFMLIPIVNITLALVSGSIFTGVIFSVSKIKMTRLLTKNLTKENYAYYYVFDKFMMSVIVPLGILFVSFLTSYIYISYILFIVGLFGLSLTLTLNIESDDL